MKDQFDMICAEQAQEGEWLLSGMDKALMSMRLRGTWVFPKGFDVQRLKQSLSSLLSHYPHLTGRMVDAEKVRFTNEGVPFYVRRAPHTIAALAADHSNATSLAHFPNKKKACQGDEAGCTVTLTHLEDGAVLSITCLHALMDGNSFYNMAYHWGRIYAGEAIEPPVLDQSLLPQLPDWTKEQASQQAQVAGFEKISIWKALKKALPSLWYLITNKQALRARAIHLDEDFIRKLQAQAIEVSGCQDISRNDALCAHISKQLMSLLGHGPETTCSQIVIIDARRRVGRVPASFVGNGAFSADGAIFTGAASFGDIATQTHKALSPYLQRPSKVLEERMAMGLALIHHKLPYLPFDIFGMHTKKPTLFYFNNFAKFPIYETNFGDDTAPLRPALVIPHDLPDPLMLWPAPPDKGGLELYLTGRLAQAVSTPEAMSRWRSALQSLPL